MPVIEQALASSERVLVVVHKGVIKAIVASLLETKVRDDVELPLGSVHRFTRVNGRWQAHDPPWNEE